MQLPAKCETALALLYEAYRYARDAQRQPQDFAVEIETLATAGLNHSDLRWLVCKGYVDDLEEETQERDERRSFRAGQHLTYTRMTCFVLTKRGAALARRILDRSETPTPRWNAKTRELRVDGKLVKKYKVPCPNQEKVLTAFEEDGWPTRIDDPLPPRAKMKRKQRLHDTIKSLNQNQKLHLLRFHGDGTGEGVVWEVISVE